MQPLDFSLGMAAGVAAALSLQFTWRRFRARQQALRQHRLWLQRLQQSGLRSFLEQHCDLTTQESLPGTQLYQAYQGWVLENATPATELFFKWDFNQALRELGFRQIRTRDGVRAWEGLRLRQPKEA